MELLDREAPDVAVLDINLRGQLVTPVTVALRSAGIPFLLSSAYELSGLGGADILKDAENVGKPARPHRLLTALVRLGGGREPHRTP